MPTPMQYGMALQNMGQQQPMQPMQPLFGQVPQSGAMGQMPQMQTPQQQQNPLQGMALEQLRKNIKAQGGLGGLFGATNNAGAAAAPQYYSATDGGLWG